jgi:hypothetical protein
MKKEFMMKCSKCGNDTFWLFHGSYRCIKCKHDNGVSDSVGGTMFDGKCGCENKHWYRRVFVGGSFFDENGNDVYRCPECNQSIIQIEDEYPEGLKFGDCTQIKCDCGCEIVGDGNGGLVNCPLCGTEIDLTYPADPNDCLHDYPLCAKCGRANFIVKNGTYTCQSCREVYA